MQRVILVGILFALSFPLQVPADNSNRKVNRPKRIHYRDTSTPSLHPNFVSTPSSMQPTVVSTLNDTKGVPSTTLLSPLSTVAPNNTKTNTTTVTNITLNSNNNTTGNITTGNNTTGNNTIGNNTIGNYTTGNDTTDNDTFVDVMTPPVIITITTPAPSKNLLFKIGTNITFAWKYSANFSIKPKYINVLAQPSVNLEEYLTIVANASGNITSVIWDTSKDMSLPVTKYKLYIFDERGKDAGISPGRLLPYSGLSFSLYQPQDRVDISLFRKNSIMSNITNTETPTSNNTVFRNTTTNFDLSKIDSNVKAYINA
ncbi:2810_t:CDS:2, partial [Scutellospora calospora]